MEDKRIHIDELYREELGNYTEMPSPAVWQSLNNRLNADQVEKPAFPWRTWLWRILALIALSGILYFAAKSTMDYYGKRPANPDTNEPNEAPAPAPANPYRTSAGSKPLHNDVPAEQGTTLTHAEETINNKNSAAQTTRISSGSAAMPAIAPKQAEAKHGSAQKPASANTGKQTTNNTLADNKPAQQKKHTAKDNKQTAPATKQPAVAASTDNTDNNAIADNKPAQQKKHTTKNNKSNAHATKQPVVATSTDNTDNNTVAHNKPAQQKKHTTKNNKQTAPATKQPVVVASTDNTDNNTIADNKPTQQKKHTTKNNKTTAPATKQPVVAASTDNTDNNTVADNKPAQQKKHSTKNNKQTAPANKQLTAASIDNTDNKPAQQKTNASKKKTTQSGNNATSDKSVANKKQNTRSNPSGSVASSGSKKPSGKKPSPQPNEKPMAAGSLPNYTMPPVAPNGKPLSKKNNTPNSKPKATPQDDRNKIPDYLRVDKHEKWDDAGSGDDAMTKNEDDGKEDAGSGGGGGGNTSTAPDKKSKIRLSGGVKAGYEMGSGTYHANSYVFAPYLELTLADNISLVCQPAFKYARLNKTKLDDIQSYYDLKGGKLDSAHQLIQIGLDSFGNPVYNIRRKYLYSQVHDSVVVSTSISKKTYFEYELPLMLQYKLAKGFNFYIGASANFSKVVQIAEQKTTYANIARYDSLTFAPVAQNEPTPSVPSVNNKFSYNYPSLATYNPSAVQNATTNPVRFNYIIGFNVSIWQRLMADVLIQGLLSNPSYIPDSRIRDIYKQPHVRITLGYRLGK